MLRPMVGKRRLAAPFVVTAAVAAAAAGCGGSSSSDGSGGTVSSGGSGGSATGGGGTGGNSAGCPATEPVGGDACNVDPSTTCDYGDCCPSHYNCQNKVWQPQISTCNPPALICPDTPPAVGDSCSHCAVVITPCAYPCGDSGTTLTAACADTDTWTLSPSGC
jgi:hypothetical protein